MILTRECKFLLVIASRSCEEQGDEAGGVAISLRFLATLGMTLRVRLLRHFVPRNDTINP